MADQNIGLPNSSVLNTSEKKPVLYESLNFDEFKVEMPQFEGLLLFYFNFVCYAISYFNFANAVTPQCFPQKKKQKKIVTKSQWTFAHGQKKTKKNKKKRQ